MQCVYPVTIKNPALKNKVGIPIDTLPDGSFVYDDGEVLPSAISVPCGRCVVCQENRRNMWADRLELESRVSPVSYFVTLTYDDRHYPGELKKHDTQLFFKRLRHKVPCRFFLCGEYGDKFQRAHYHTVIFPREFILQEEFERAVEASWRNGFVRVRLADREAFRYVAKYTVKSIGNCPEGLQAPFALMSRRPGISADYLPVLSNYYHEFIVLGNGVSRPLPEYLRLKLPEFEGLRIREARREYASKLPKLSDTDKLLRSINLERSLIRKYNRKHGTFTSSISPGDACDEA